MKRRQFLGLAGFLTGCGAAVPFGRLASPIAQPQTTSALPLLPKGFSAPPKGDVRIAVISDLNSQYGATDYEPEVHQAIALLPAWQPDLVLCGGDMVAGQSNRLSDAQVRAMWDGFDRAIGAPLRQAKLPLGFTVGNHDGSGALGVEGRLTFARDRQLAQSYWLKHPPVLNWIDRRQFPFNYSFVQNGIFFLVWDASTALMPAQQWAWVEKSLASAPAQQARLRIVLGHLPLYAVAVGRDKPGEYLADAPQLQALLERYRVHTYISGHNHAYYPGHRGKLQFLQTGALGSGPRRWLGSALSPRKTLTLVDVWETNGNIRYTTFDLTHQTVFDPKLLPRMMTAPNGSILRQDIEPAALTPAERAQFLS